ncbi:hypothetical protein HanXRQr2_Chr10g0452561 [Helianthus annuus]|uniref:Uncharacterized protein n=1 Tax=Helianthus annuus TaxID=4232 RepID=A0A251TNN9_HELAN|nr:hypothetical protein HanXRQr2_Chr10g0452561 [Helianthus annuus]
MTFNELSRSRVSASLKPFRETGVTSRLLNKLRNALKKATILMLLRFVGFFLFKVCENE